MKRLLLMVMMNNIMLLADQNQPIEPITQGLLAWVIGFLLIIGVMFWSFYKMMRTKNPRYGYVVLVTLGIMVGMFFI